MDLDSPSLVSCLAHVTRLFARKHRRSHSIPFDQCAFVTPWKLRSKLISGHCDYQGIPLFGGSVPVKNIMFVPYSRRLTANSMAVISMDDSFTACCKVLPLRLCSKLCIIINLQRNR